MNEAAIREKLTELAESLTISPKVSSTAASAEGIYQSASLVSKLSVEESLDYLRLQAKYLVFDLEATQRENRYLRQMLENRGNRRPDSGDEDINRWR